MTSIKVGIIGMGFMGRTHAAAYRAMMPLLASKGIECELVAVCDPNRSRLNPFATHTGNLATTGGEALWDNDRVRGFTDATEFFECELDLVSICTHTDSHVTLGEHGLRYGKNLLMEKPVALTTQEIDILRSASAQHNKICMPAMCMRFWPGWMELAKAVRSSTYGQLSSITFQRLGTAPGWGDGFYASDARSGGVVFDLHIHDADFVYHLFGKPDAVRSVGGSRHISTQYIYNGKNEHVTAEGAWDLAPCAGFRMRYVANFERATLEFDLAKSPMLMVHTAEHSTPAIEACGWANGYEGEVFAAVSAAAGHSVTIPTLDDAHAVTQILLQERASIQSLRS